MLCSIRSILIGWNKLNNQHSVNLGAIFSFYNRLLIRIEKISFAISVKNSSKTQNGSTLRRSVLSNNTLLDFVSFKLSKYALFDCEKCIPLLKHLQPHIHTVLFRIKILSHFQTIVIPINGIRPTTSKSASKLVHIPNRKATTQRFVSAPEPASASSPNRVVENSPGPSLLSQTDASQHVSPLKASSTRFAFPPGKESINLSYFQVS